MWSARLNRRPDGLDQDVRTKIAAQVRQMESYLRVLSLEFRDNYRWLADEPRDYHDGLSRLDGLADLVSAGPGYRETFEEPLDTASELLRRQLARILSSTS